MFCLAVWLGLSACSAFRSSGWNLPVKLGSTKSEVYALLGDPSGQLANSESFQNSGLAIDYDPGGRVSKVIVYGPSNSNFITYKEPVVFGLKVTDTVERFLAVLGEPAIH